MYQNQSIQGLILNQKYLCACARRTKEDNKRISVQILKEQMVAMEAEYAHFEDFVLAKAELSPAQEAQLQTVSR
jgi:hypothetical protein